MDRAVERLHNSKSSLLLSFKKEESSFLKKRSKRLLSHTLAAPSAPPFARIFMLLGRQTQVSNYKFFGSFFKKELLRWRLTSFDGESFSTRFGIMPQQNLPELPRSKPRRAAERETEIRRARETQHLR